MQPNDITFFNVSRMTFWLGVKPSPSVTNLNRTLKRAMYFASGALKMMAIFALLKSPQLQQ